MVECILAPLANPETCEGRGIRFVSESGEETYASYLEFAQLALNYCSALTQLGVQEGDLVMLSFPASIEYVGLLMGCILAGALPCTVPPLGRRIVKSINSVIEIASRVYQPKILFTPDASAEQARAMVGEHGVRVVDSSNLALAIMADGVPKISIRQPSDPHHVQLTSGSVAYPKAAVLTHQSVIDNSLGIGGAVGYNVANGDGSATWLPMHHDMGLLTLLSNYVYKSSLLIMQPASFIRNPLGWLKRIASTGATTTSVPTFALRYCVRRFNAKSMEGVDLSRCRNIFVGAERVDLTTLQEFADTFAPYGLRGSTLQPCYGMAETTLAVTMQHVPHHSPSDVSMPHVHADSIDASALIERRIATAVTDFPGRRAETVLSVGTPIAGMEYVIRDGCGLPVAQRVTGEIFTRGTSMMRGYLPGHKNAVVTEFDDAGWMATGDIGYEANGELFILGRKKEIIIIRGCNYFPHEIEEILAEHVSVVKGGCATVGVHDENQGTEKLVVFVETPSTHNLPILRSELQSLLLRHVGFAASDIVFVGPGELPRTTSGKLQHFLCRELYIAGALCNVPEVADRSDVQMLEGGDVDDASTEVGEFSSSNSL